MSAIQVLKRDGKTVQAYNVENVRKAILGAFTDVHGDIATKRFWEEVCELSKKVGNQVPGIMVPDTEPNGTLVARVEDIQDLAEKVLMQSGYPAEARAFIVYREEHRKAREKKKSVFEPRKNFKPFEYDVEHFKTAIHKPFWTVSHFNFVSDVHEYKTQLWPVEQSAIKNAILAIAQIEVGVKEFWARIGDRFPKPEFKQIGYVFADCEVRHADAYSQLLQDLGLNADFEKVLDVPAIAGRVAYLQESLQGSASAANEDYSLILSLFSLFVENVSLFSQFLIIKSFYKHRQILKDVDNVVQATQQEEQIHALFGAHLVNLIKDEKPEWFNQFFYERLYYAAGKAMTAENRIIDWIFEAGELSFLSAATVKNFIANRMNESLKMIGGDAVFPVNAELLKETLWFDEGLIGKTRGDFFHKTPTTYSMDGGFTEEDLW